MRIIISLLFRTWRIGLGPPSRDCGIESPHARLLLFGQARNRGGIRSLNISKLALARREIGLPSQCSESSFFVSFSTT
jgi:hypothetical protein